MGIAVNRESQPSGSGPIYERVVLCFIDEGLMAKTGNRFEWKAMPWLGIPLVGLEYFRSA